MFFLLLFFIIALYEFVSAYDVNINTVEDFEKIGLIDRLKNPYINVFLMKNLDFFNVTYKSLNLTNAVFDGNNHVIENIGASLFQYVFGNVTIRNLKLDSSCNGALANFIYLNSSNCTIEYIELNEKIEIECDGNCIVGGLVNQVVLKNDSSLTIQNSISAGTLFCYNCASLSGLIGEIDSSINSQVYLNFLENYANISSICTNQHCKSSGISNLQSGGIIRIDNCANFGNLNVTLGYQSGDAYSCGIVCCSSELELYIRNTQNEGSVSSFFSFGISNYVHNITLSKNYGTIFGYQVASGLFQNAVFSEWVENHGDIESEHSCYGIGINCHELMYYALNDGIMKGNNVYGIAYNVNKAFFLLNKAFFGKGYLVMA